MSKVRVLQFPIANSNGGITHYAVGNWSFMDKDKFSCDFATMSKHLDFEKSIIDSGAGVKYISCYAEDNADRFASEIEKLLRNNYDVVHLHTSFWKSFLVEEIAIRCGIPEIIVHAHSTRIDISDDEKRKQAEEIHEMRKKQFNISLATDFCACSNLAGDWLFGDQIPRDRIKIMKNAVNIEKFIFNKKVREKYRHDLGLEDCFVIGNVGRFVYPKNQEFLIEVFAEVCKKVKNARLVLVGTGMLEGKYKETVKKLKIEDKVIFLGNRDDVSNLLQAMDLFCLPSRFEGLGIALIEAQASGLKCIGSEEVPEEALVTDNIKVIQLMADKWSESIIEASNEYERKNMYDELTEAGYNIKSQIKNVENLYLGK